MSATPEQVTQQTPLGLLFVDDEQNILSAMRRLFRPHGYRIFLAGSGAEGLEIMAKENVDLVVSDMRMPEMDGAQFLAKVAESWPETVRILLTGYSDLASTIDAINRGGIYRYLSKPWEDNDLVLTIQQALKHKELERERDQLLELTRKQNDELTHINANLEKMVAARTAEIQQTADMLDAAYAEMKLSYTTAIPVFANLVELREGADAGHGRRVADMARNLAIYMGLNETLAQDVYHAGLLHDVGKIGLPFAITNKPISQLTPDERKLMERHPVSGATALMALEPMTNTARIIRSHHELFDGTGYPDRLIGEKIPHGARILTVVNEYDSLMQGMLLGRKLSADEARDYIDAHRFKRYDSRVVDAFLKMLDGAKLEHKATGEAIMTSIELEAGMILSRDLVNQDGQLLLTKGFRLNDKIIHKIRAHEQDVGRKLVLHVRHTQGHML